ncbi:conserved exported hypothetical protein [Crenothrix polyspora]|uniref:Uncharacterized protein n=1 Tax=Crenothrix polyspora TaxID=360316 RepID=A0A1R4H7S4_9GAMM|nr:tetratricopeptide repeat protein [Crenothrix polyspora]SJM92217.1 conserved exported hypothetical protein [Crenothrix polyspora]
MTIKQFFAPCTLIVLLTGCASDYYQAQYPAPVYGGHPPINTQPPPVVKPVVPDAGTVITQPLKEFKPHPVPVEIAPDPVIQEPEEPQPVPEEKVEELPPLVEEVPAPEAQTTPEPEAATPFTPLESNAHLSAPVSALVLAAKQDTDSGNPEAAGAAIERAIRIEPRNATLYYKLAVVRLNQSQPRLAEDLAKKAALLASDDRELKKHSWLLIAKARELLSNPEGAKAAKKKAGSF